jgi:hypothetical protein
MINSEELIETTEHLTLQMRCHTNQCWHKQVQLYNSHMTCKDDRVTKGRNGCGIYHAYQNMMCT